MSILALHAGPDQSGLARVLQLTSSASHHRVPTDRGRRTATKSQGCLAHALRLLDPDRLAGFAAGLVVVADDLDGVADGMSAGATDPVPTHAPPVAQELGPGHRLSPDPRTVLFRPSPHPDIATVEKLFGRWFNVVDVGRGQ
ncbi:MAG: hypothetical protein ACRYG2_24640 [Janthinobacterium lividum]